MKLIKCPNCRLCIDLEILVEIDLCPMCGMPFDYSIEKNLVNIDNKC
ncbi:MAG: hypothetical protein ACFE9C_01245 [Candidatus Hodarchaeota archaeon]